MITDKETKLLQSIRTMNDATKVYKKHILVKTLIIIIASLSLILLGVYGGLYLFNQSGVFTVNIKDVDPKVSISLFESMEFDNPTSHMSFDSHAPLNNIDGNDLKSTLNNVDGDHSDENGEYLAFTFYLKNVGTADIDVEASIEIKDVVKGADEAIRIKVYEDGEQTIYAKAAQDGSPETSPSITTPFVDDQTVFTNSFELDVDEYKKYTIVIWLEGNDPECINDICGGFVRLDMKFNGKAKT